ncbi:uncharacterized protein LOC135941397 [Cloeon dipterum]|uniref:uncharacterized protein LOC135941397 n=1 Tax=Cloeon dipterum TaxID=197152 RepID=UPI0032201D28
MRLLSVVVLLHVLAALDAASNSSSASAELPKEHRTAAASSKEIVTKIVKKIKGMADQHKLPSWLNEQIYQYEDPIASGHPHAYHVIKDEEPTSDSIFSPTGVNIKGMLGFVEYLILLILLKGSIDHVAERYKLSNKIKDQEFLARKTRDLNELSTKILQRLH